ncbi:MAG: tetratricopeptide repeat protein [Nitrospira sp.]|nr:tetratricopeptide repeat protein [Nitrospira sp.]
MKQISVVACVLFAGLIPILASCESNKPESPAVKTSAAAVPAPETALIAAAGSPGQAANDKAVSQYKEGKIEAAIEGFEKAAKADPKSAEVQYNLGLSFDRIGKHDQAATAFKQATALSPTNPTIKDSAIAKKHTS